MASAENESEREKETAAFNLKEKVENKYKELREHAEAYPYVWASYIFVYGGLALWTTYRWRKLRNTENRVRLLQQRLRKLVEAEELSSSSSATIDKPKE